MDLSSKDLDTLIRQERLVMEHLKTLDTPEKYGDVCIGAILDECGQAAALLQGPQEQPCPPAAEAAPPAPPDSTARRIDRWLQKSGLYTRFLRPGILPLAKRLFRKRRVHARDLMALEGGAFVDACYQALLERPAEPAAMQDLCARLANGETRKLYALLGIAGSPEAQRHPVRLCGTARYRVREWARKLLAHIPGARQIMAHSTDLHILQMRVEQLTAQTQELQRQIRQDREIARQDRDCAVETLRQEARESLIRQEMRRAKLGHRLESEAQRLERRIGGTEQGLARLLEEEEKGSQRRERFVSRLNDFYVHYEETLTPKAEAGFLATHGQYFEKIDAWAQGRDKAQLAMADLGCGAGLWLRLLTERGYRPVGVDSNPKMLERARACAGESRLVCQDAVAFLREQADASWDLLSSFHMIEHMDTMALFEFFDDCKRVLRPGGLLLLETPNPKNILTATEMFRLDVTHKNIIPMELLVFCMEEWGFERVESVPVSPYNYFPMEYEQNDPVSSMAFRFNNETEYSVWAVKPV